MNSRQLQCAILLAEIRNYSQVAEKLNISQPALSKHILNLEKELGVRLFDRETVPLTLTPAGEQFVQGAQDLLYKEEQLIKTMERFRTGQQGKLVVGISPFRSLYLMSDVIKAIQKKFPGVQVCLHEAASDQLRKEMAEGKFDFAVVNLPVDESILNIVPFEAEKLVLAVPEGMVAAISTSANEGLPVIDLAQCREIPFVTVSPTQELRRLFEQLCAQADFRPHIAVETVGLATAWAMVQAGIGAALLPLRFVDGENKRDGIRLFAIKSALSTRQPVIITRRGQALTEYAQYAIELLTERG